MSKNDGDVRIQDDDENMRWIVFLVATAISLFSVFADDLIIATNKGKVRGVTETAHTGQKVDMWLGIPYAKKPLDDLRFQATVPAKKWRGVLDTTTWPNVCVQTEDTFFGNFSGAKMWLPNRPVSEDCLYLNVIVPKPRPHNATVMVWIYGGGFYSGSSTLEIYDPKVFVAEQNVIIVSMQYRLASLGFLYFGTSDAPGNVGFLDQVMALQWVHDNIANFGGNPNDVTIFGESAGSGSVSLHLLSPLSRSFFHRGIMQSGTATAPWAVIDTKIAKERGLYVAKEVGCPHNGDNIPATLDCLRKVDATKLVYAEQNVPLRGIIDFTFLPVIDGAFIDSDPVSKLKSKNFEKKDILLGANGQEGNYFLFYFFPDTYKLGDAPTVTRQQFLNFIPQLRKDRSKLEELAIAHEYTNWNNPNDPIQNAKIFDEIIGDEYFTCCMNDFAENWAEAGGNVYMYHFKHVSPAHHWPTWSGTLHADEIAFVFGEAFKPESSYTEAQKKFSTRVMRYWSNFAKTGNPNKPADVSECHWSEFNQNTQKYINLDVDHCSVEDGGLKPKHCAFWKKFIPQLRAIAK
ncbi:hypothetical protein FQA39_LY08853 [Lamprigera yunnana]|nr:hypothetical protein FQA39_LY08853 [Lamprigera yunnana]